MPVHPWFRSFQHELRRARQARHRAVRYLPRVESLEARTVLTFARPVNYLVNGTAPVWVAAGDFNGDRVPDLVTANLRSASISVLPGNGDGTFGPARNYAADRNPNCVAAGDFNNDQILDLLVATAGSNNLALLLGNGDGTFRDAEYFFAGQEPSTVGLGDLNGDGNLDAVTANNEPDRLTVLLGSGDGTFRPATSFAVGLDPEAVLIADFNHDGRQDVASVGHRFGGLQVHRGNGDGTFIGPLGSGGMGLGRHAVADDYNRDGMLDLAVSDSQRGVISLFLGGGDGTFFSRREFGAGPGAFGIGQGDFNADGLVDIVTANTANSSVAALFGNGDGTFRPPVSYPAGSRAQGIAVGDWNLDGLPDLAVANVDSNNVSILLNDINAVERLRVNAPAGATAGAVFPLTVSALTRSGNVASGYRGTVRFTSSDPTASLPPDYTFTVADQGARSFTVTLRTAGSRTITVTDTTNGSITGTASVLVNPAAASTFVVAGFPSPVVAGAVETFSVTARDPFGNVASGYRGTVRFTSSDGQATLPFNYTFSVADNGVRHFGAVLKTAGIQSLTATDTVNGSIMGTQNEIVVNPGQATNFFLEAPETVLAGTPFDLTVVALDPFGNVATGYRGGIGFLATDPDAVLPGEYSFTADDAGIAFFTTGVILFAEGEQSLLVYDTMSLFTGGAVVNVVPAGAPGGGRSPGEGLDNLDVLDRLFARVPWDQRRLRKVGGWSWAEVRGRM